MTAIEDARAALASPTGWVEWQMPGVRTTHVAYVHENGDVYDPEHGWNPVDFVGSALEHNAQHRLVRAEVLEALVAEHERVVERAAQEADRGYLHNENCDDIAARIRALAVTLRPTPSDRDGMARATAMVEDKSRTHCKECREGKHGACDGSMYVEDLDVFEACGCAAYDWNGEHTTGGGHG